MSLRSFQEALAEIITSPQIGQAYYADPALLDQKYTLSEKERNRLLGMIRQKGMRANYMLYQMNRLTPLTMLMAYTLKILHPQLMSVLHPFWKAYPKTSFQFRDEIAYFSAFLKKQITEETLDHPFLEDVVNLEEAINDIRFNTEEQESFNDEFYTLHPSARIIYMQHDAAELVEVMVTYDSAQPLPPVTVAPGYYLLYYNGRLTTYPVDEPTAMALIEKRPVEDVPDDLVEIGLLV